MITEYIILLLTIGIAYFDARFDASVLNKESENFHIVFARILVITYLVFFYWLLSCVMISGWAVFVCVVDFH